MKNLSSYLNEKLIINKNFKDVNANNKFYNKFRKVLSSKSKFGWFEIRGIANSIPMKLSIEDKTASNKIKEFFNIDNIIYTRAVIENFKKECELYYDILKFINDNKDGMEFFYINEHTKSGDYLIYLFEAGKIKVAVWGNKEIVGNNIAAITFQYI